jgi:hypothetical protein
VAGDGVVPVDSAMLPGSESMVMDGIYHNKRLGRWYGSDQETVSRWWSGKLGAGGSVGGGRTGSNLQSVPTSGEGVDAT